LLGLFPFTLSRSLRGLPVRVAHLLTRFYFSSSVPLIHRDVATSVLSALWAWMRTGKSPAPILQFVSLPADGPFFASLSQTIFSSQKPSLIEVLYPRAAFLHEVERADYYQSNFSGRARKQHRRQKELLSEQGKWSFETLTPDQDCEPWVAEFLRLESSGWKGEQGTALASNPADANFFRAAAANAHAQQRLLMHRISLDGRAIASRCAWRAGDGAFLFKIAYDESLAKFSPGILLEVECILNSLETDPVWTDSCTVRDNPVYPKLWSERRMIADLFVSCGRTRADLVLTGIPVLRVVKRILRKVSGREGRLPTGDKPSPKD
jgi:hypothetical protein